MKRWVKIPAPGQFRGEGTWTDFDTLTGSSDKNWEQLKATSFLPTQESDEQPKPAKYYSLD